MASSKRFIWRTGEPKFERSAREAELSLPGRKIMPGFFQQRRRPFKKRTAATAERLTKAEGKRLRRIGRNLAVMARQVKP